MAAWYFLFRTRTGLEFRCAGEYPKALDTKGLNVARRQAIAIMIGSAMSGLGGAFLMPGYSEKFLPELVAGRGWLVIVAIIAGNWIPFRTVGAILIFSLLEAVAIHAQVLNIQIPSQLFLALPYLASLILLAVFRSVSHQPAWLGKPSHRD